MVTKFSGVWSKSFPLFKFKIIPILNFKNFKILNNFQIPNGFCEEMFIADLDRSICFFDARSNVIAAAIFINVIIRFSVIWYIAYITRFSNS